MRKHSRRIKTRRRRNSRKLKGGKPFTRFFGFGQPAPAPGEAQGVTTARVESDEFNHHQKQAEAKQQQLNELNAKCEEFQNTGRAEMESAIAKHQQSAARISQNRENKNRCDEQHANRLQTAEGVHARASQLAETAHNEALQRAETARTEALQTAQETLKAAQESSKNQHQQCLADGMGLTRYPQALAQNPQSVAAATRIQRARRAEAARRAEVARAEAAAADVEPLAGLAVSPSGGGGRKSRRGGRKSRRGGRKSRRGGAGCGSHKKKMMYAGRKSRRGGAGCGSHKKKMMYAGRKSRRGGTYCSRKSGKKCPYYKKYGYHKM